MLRNDRKYWKSSFSLIKHFPWEQKTLHFLTLPSDLSQDVSGSIHWHHWAWQHAQWKVVYAMCSEPRLQWGVMIHGWVSASRNTLNALHVWFQIQFWLLRILLLPNFLWPHIQFCDPVWESKKLGFAVLQSTRKLKWFLVTVKEIHCSWDGMDLPLVTHFIQTQQCSPLIQPKALFLCEETPPFQMNRGPCYRTQSEKAASTNENTRKSSPSWPYFVRS